MHTLLVVDDEPSIRYSLQQVFAGSDIEVIEAECAAHAFQQFQDHAPDVVLLDICLGKDDGLIVFEKLREIDPKCLVVFITGHGTSETAIKAIKQGAYDYLVKPLDRDQVIDVVSQAIRIRRLMRTPAIVEEPEHDVDNPDMIIGGSPIMRTIFKQIGRVAAQNINVLILGESGTGKELVARAIYHHSARQAAPFLAINCAALTETLLESELFGHEKGAFTGADRQRVGKFEQTNQGTMFLDEVGDMSLSTQSKMLRLLQDGSFERVGGSEVLKVDVRVIAATNKNLEAMVQDGSFRLDLFYRLRGVAIELPPLRHRQADLPELAHYFLYRFNRDLGTSVTTIAEETLEQLQQYSWPGNIRELQSVIREALLGSAGPTLLPEFLPEHIARVSTSVAMPPGNGTSDVTWDSLARDVQSAIEQSENGIYRLALEKFDRLLVTAVMNKTKGNQAAAAEILGLSRPTLRSKLRAMTSDSPAADE